MKNNDTQLESIEKFTPEEVFTNNGYSSILDKIEAVAKNFEGDATTYEGRDQIRSFAYKIARSKTALDDMGKELVKNWKKKAALIDEQRRTVRIRLDELKDKVRKPLTDYENTEKERIEVRNNRISQISQMPFDLMDINHIKEAIEKIKSLINFDWQEFKDKAEAAYQEKLEFYNLKITAIEKEIADKEADKEAAKKAEEDRKIREEQIRISAKKEAEAEAAQKILQIEKEKQNLEIKKNLAEQEVANIKNDSSEKIGDISKEKRRKINNQLLESFTSILGNKELARKLLIEIAKDNIENIKIIY